MRCHLVAVGRSRPGPADQLFQHYAQLLSPPLAVIEVEEKRKLPPALRKDREAELLIAALPRGAFLVLLDEHGTALSSEGLARQLGQWRDRGVADLVFAIGGAAGHGMAARVRADFVLSLGPLTWPHLMVRPMLAEQLYRGFSILAGHPYHRA